MEVVIARDVNCFRSASYDVLTAVNFAHGKLVKTVFLSSTLERMIESWQRAHEEDQLYISVNTIDAILSLS